MSSQPTQENLVTSQAGHYESYVLNFPGMERFALATYSRIADYTAKYGQTSLGNGRLAEDLKAAPVTIGAHVKFLAKVGLVLLYRHQFFGHKTKVNLTVIKQLRG